MPGSDECSRCFAREPRHAYGLSALYSADAGILTPEAAERLMDETVERRVANEIPDLLLFLAHPPCVSVGVRDRRVESPPDLLVPLDKLTTEGIGFARVVRGGGITFHWPGQVVCCPIMLLHPDSRDVGGFMAKLERVAVAALAAFGISAETRRDTPAHIGLWHRGKKIVSMGVRIRNWVTGFGFAINVSGDYSPAKYIRPCGIRDATLVDMASILGYAPPRCEVKAAVAEGFSTVFGRETRALTPEAPGFHVAEKIIRAHSQGTE